MITVLPARLEWLEALSAGDDTFTARYGIPVATGWVGFPEALPFAVEGARRNSTDPWGTHFFFEDGALVGFGGWKGAPSDGRVELGYAVAPARQGRGIATDVVRQLVARAEAEGVDVVVAHTLPEENASTAVLRKCGFDGPADATEDGESAVWSWELTVNTR